MNNAIKYQNQLW